MWNLLKTVWAQGLNRESDGSGLFNDVPLFTQIVGSLLGLSIMVSPDTVFAVEYCSRFMHRPAQMTWNAEKRKEGYPSGTKERG